MTLEPERVTVVGQSFGSEASLRRLIAPLARIAGAQIDAGTDTYLGRATPLGDPGRPDHVRRGLPVRRPAARRRRARDAFVDAFADHRAGSSTPTAVRSADVPAGATPRSCTAARASASRSSTTGRASSTRRRRSPAPTRLLALFRQRRGLPELPGPFALSRPPARLVRRQTSRACAGSSAATTRTTASGSARGSSAVVGRAGAAAGGSSPG